MQHDTVRCSPIPRAFSLTGDAAFEESHAQPLGRVPADPLHEQDFARRHFRHQCEGCLPGTASNTATATAILPYIYTYIDYSYIVTLILLLWYWYWYRYTPTYIAILSGLVGNLHTC